MVELDFYLKTVDNKTKIYSWAHYVQMDVSGTFKCKRCNFSVTVHEGVLHNTRGPALIDYSFDSPYLWYIDGICYTKFGDWLEANDEISDEEKIELVLKYG